MAYPYSITIRSTGTLITASIWNGDQTLHATENRPQSIDDYAATVPQFQTVTDPGEVGTESLPTTLAEELERLRFAIQELKPGAAQWYSTGGTQGDPVYAEVFGS